MNTLTIHRPGSIRIAMLILYFGKVPFFFRFFIASCAYNPDIDFIIVSDIDFKEEFPKNVTVVRRTLEDIKRKAEELFSFEVCLNRPYKVCDFRPAFGLLFEDLIEGYDFFGYGDIDIVYGNVRKFITDKMLSENDAISIRAQYFTGFFALLRNTEKIKNLFKESKDYKKVFQTPGSYCFDEMNWHWAELMQGKSIFQVQSEVESMTYVVRKLTLCGEIRSHFEELVVERCDGKLDWNRGVLTYDKKEIILFHFIEFKDSSVIYVPKWKKIPDRYYVGPFYYTRHSPKSVRGRLLHLSLMGWKYIYDYTAAGIQFVEWASKYLVSSRKADDNRVPLMNQIPGTYKLHHDNTVVVQLVNGNLYALWQKRFIRLLHLRKNKFVVSKFYLGGSFDIALEFFFDKERSAYALSIVAYKTARLVLFKV